jgi:hypothetical protein
VKRGCGTEAELVQRPPSDKKQKNLFDVSIAEGGWGRDAKSAIYRHPFFGVRCLSFYESRVGGGRDG